MQIIEVKNNLVKIGYEPSQEELILSGFLAIKDESQPQSSSFIGQVMHLEAGTKGHFAIVKLLFNFDSEGVISNYNGSIPTIASVINYVDTQDLLGLLPIQYPVVVGEIAQQKVVLKLDETLFAEKLVVCCDKEDDKKILIENINAQLSHSEKKVLVIDLSGNCGFSSNKIVASENFKLPLNYNTINFIYEKGLESTTPETKALIQEIFLEVQEYIKTLVGGFIPFESFKNVVDSQYEELGIVELVLLKNKLLKYYEEGIFAQTSPEFDTLRLSLEQNETTILDLSKVEEKIQREIISYAYSLINQSNRDVFVIVNVDNANSDKKLLKQIYTTNKAFSTVICSYSYKYLNELKQLAKDLILFAPINQQKDFASYNTFLNKLNSDEFIIYGSSTHNIPLIVKLDDTPQKVFEELISEGFVDDQQEITYQEVYPEAQEKAYDESFVENSPIQYTEVSHEELLKEEIRQGVDQIYTTPQYETEEEEYSEEGFETQEGEDLTEDDLDFIDDLSVVQDELPKEEVSQTESVVGEASIEDEFGEGFFNESNEQIFAATEPLFEKPSEATFSEEINVQQTEMEAPLSAVTEGSKPALDILPASESFIPNLPIYPAELGDNMTTDSLEQGDVVVHAKYGKGTVEKMISYGTKTLCSIHFDNIGRRLLDPTLAELKKV